MNTRSDMTDVPAESSPIERLGNAINQSLDEAPAGEVLRFLTGAFVSLAVELVRREGHDHRLPIHIEGGSNRNITIYGPKEPADPQPKDGSDAISIGCGFLNRGQ